MDIRTLLRLTLAYQSVQSEEDLQLRNELEMLVERLKVHLTLRLLNPTTIDFCHRSPTLLCTDQR